MIVIRKGVWETNSSATHAITVFDDMNDEHYVCPRIRKGKVVITGMDEFYGTQLYFQEKLNYIVTHIIGSCFGDGWGTSVFKEDLESCEPLNKFSKELCEKLKEYGFEADGLDFSNCLVPRFDSDAKTKAAMKEGIPCFRLEYEIDHQLIDNIEEIDNQIGACTKGDSEYDYKRNETPKSDLEILFDPNLAIYIGHD